MLRTLRNLFTANHTTEPDKQPSHSEDYYIPQSAKELLAAPKRQQLMQQIWQYTSVTKESFATLYIEPIEQYAQLVQQFPASESHHHSYLGGLLDHGLELIAHALKIRRSYLLPPGAPPEDQAVQGDAWTAAITYGGLLHDIGKIVVDIQVQLKDGSEWHPWLGTLNQPYRFKYIKGRNYHLHDVATGLVYYQILTPTILNWLCQYPELWGCLINLLAGNYEQAGLLGEIVKKADKVSTAKNIGANPEKAMQAPAQSLQKKLLTGLKELIKNEFKLNTTPGEAWLTQEALWLMSNTTATKLRANLVRQGFEGIPTNNSILFDELQSYGIIQANTESKAIWKATVSDKNNQWQQEFSLIRVPPSLIWSNETWPEFFDGQITIKDSAIQLEQHTNISIDNEINLLNISTAVANQQSITPVLDSITPTVTDTKVFDINQHHDETDDLLALLDGALGDTANNETTEEIEPVAEPNIGITHIAEPTILEAIKDINTIPVREEKQSIQVKPIEAVALSFDNTPTKTQLGEYFITWLKVSIQAHRLKINEIDAKLHLVNQQLFIVTPGIFQRFCAEYPELEKELSQKGTKTDSWKLIQRGFEKLKQHKKLPNDLNIWECEVRGPRKRGKIIRGYFMKEVKAFFQEIVPDDNPFLILKEPENQEDK